MMIYNLMKDLGTDRIHRIDVNFKIVDKYIYSSIIIHTTRQLETFIGRAGHIEFLENLALIKMFIYTFDDLFEWIYFNFTLIIQS